MRTEHQNIDMAIENLIPLMRCKDKKLFPAYIALDYVGVDALQAPIRKA